MTPPEAQRLAALARQLRVSPHAILLAAAVMTENPELDASGVLADLRDARPDAPPASAAILAMLRSPPLASAPAHVEDAFATLWGRGPGPAP